MQVFIRNIELFLSGAGIVVILVVPLFMEIQLLSIWQIAAITAILVGLIHGFILWAIRRKQRKVRNEALNDVRIMLNDVINNNLSIISLTSRLYGGESEKAKAATEEIAQAIESISTALDTISEESIRTWKAKY